MPLNFKIQYIYLLNSVLFHILNRC